MDKVIEEQGFNPCPICGEYESLHITSEEGFSKAKVVRIGCEACNIDLWSLGCESKSYTGHLGFLASFWNKLANTEQTKEREEKADKLLDELREFLAKNVPDADIANRIYERVYEFGRRLNHTKESKE